MRKNTRELTFVVEDDPVCPGTPPRVDFEGVEYRKLVPWERYGEVKSFVIVVLVWVGTASSSIATLLIIATSLLCSSNGFGVVVHRATSCAVCLPSENGLEERVNSQIVSTWTKH